MAPRILPLNSIPSRTATNAAADKGSAVIRQGEDMRRVDFESRRESADFVEFGKRVAHAAGISDLEVRSRRGVPYWADMTTK